MSWTRWAPLGVFAAMAILFATQLLAPETPACDRPEAFVDRGVPDFDVARLAPETGRATLADLKAPGVKVVNIWASWCAPCRVEHPHLMAMAEARAGGVGFRMIGVNYKDRPGKGRAFLAELGDPFDTVMADPNGEVAIALGVTGVPETYVVNASGRVIYRHVGQITASDVTRCLLPAVERAAGAS